MKRFHVHIAVEGLEESIAFYSALFGREPSKRKTDYAKWMLDDPRMNFAISARGAKPGVDHFGFQVDSAEELDALRGQMKREHLQPFDEGATTCCYAASEKSWLQDPDGIAWETYHTMDDVEFFNGSPGNHGAACCAHQTAQITAERGRPLLELPLAGPNDMKAGCCG